jgi:hypothetical protein
MSALINALDNYTPTQVGENGHTEYSYSHSLRERVVQLSFQLIRLTREQIESSVELELDDLLKTLKSDLVKNKWLSGVSIELLVVLYKMIGHTRDTQCGKGSYTLAYMMIYVWEKYFPELAEYAASTFVRPPEGTVGEPPYGSWKDVKHLCTYLKERDRTTENSPLVQSMVLIMVDRLKRDLELLALGQGGEQITLAGKWAPRETSAKHGWLHEVLALNMFSHYVATAKNRDSLLRAERKAKMEFRKVLSQLNVALETVQVKQCAKQWSEISPEKQTSITMFKQKRAFLNKTKKGEQKSTEEDRVVCAQKFEEYIRRAVSGEVKAKGARVSLVDFAKEALFLSSCPEAPDYKTNAALLDAQWANNSESVGALGNMIAMVDVSGSMSGDPLHAAISLGIRVAEKSVLGKRIMTFSSRPTWVNLDSCNGYTECVEKVREADWGMNTNFEKALNMILESIVSNKLPADVAQDMVLVIFSDMQMDVACGGATNDALYEEIRKKYVIAGLQTCGTPYTPPHILFWNLRSTSGFPTTSATKNVTMMSGFSAALLNTFCEKGFQELQEATPWTMLREQVDAARYDQLQHKCVEMVDRFQTEYLCSRVA